MIKSCGIIPYRINEETSQIEFLVGHPGGPYWKNKDYWALLKGRQNKGESTELTAIREFQEESGLVLTEEEKKKIWYVGFAKQRKDKIVSAFAIEKPDIDPDKCFSNQADGCNWNEIDRYRWMPYDEIIVKTHNTNVQFFKEIKSKIANWSK